MRHTIQAWAQQAQYGKHLRVSGQRATDARERRCTRAALQAWRDVVAARQAWRAKAEGIAQQVEASLLLEVVQSWRALTLQLRASKQVPALPRLPSLGRLQQMPTQYALRTDALVLQIGKPKPHLVPCVCMFGMSLT